VGIERPGLSNRWPRCSAVQRLCGGLACSGPQDRRRERRWPQAPNPSRHPFGWPPQRMSEISGGQFIRDGRDALIGTDDKVSTTTIGHIAEGGPSPSIDSSPSADKVYSGKPLTARRAAGGNQRFGDGCTVTSSDGVVMHYTDKTTFPNIGDGFWWR